MIDVKIIAAELHVADCLDVATDPSCGGVATFIGTVRNHTKGRQVVRLEYECYKSMAIKEIQKVVGKAIDTFRVKNVLVHHRIGILYPGDAAIVIVVSDGHRDAVFDACRYIIDTIKQTVPIWKKEVFADGEEWVSAHP